MNYKDLRLLLIMFFKQTRGDSGSVIINIIIFLIPNISMTLVYTLVHIFKVIIRL